MKRIILLLLILFLSMNPCRAAEASDLPAATPAPAPPPIPADTDHITTLKECIEITLLNNTTLATARSATVSAKAKVAEVRSGQQPSLGFSANYTRMGPGVSFPLPGAGNVTVVPEQNHQLQATLQQLITNFGTLNSAISAAILNLQQVELNELKVRDDTILDVQNAYYNLLEWEGYLNVAKDNLKSQEGHLQVSRHNFEVGTFPRFEVIRAEVSVEEAKQHLITAENNVALAQVSLKNLMAVNLENSLNIENIESLPELDFTIEAAQDKALRLRVEFRQMELAIQIANKLITVAKGGKKPSLLLSGNVTNVDNTLLTPSTSWVGALLFSLPVLDGGLTASKVAQARESLKQIELQAEQLRRDIRLQVKQAYLNAQEALAQLDVARKNLEFSKEAYNIASVRYEAALSTNLELQDALLALNTAKVSLVSARCNYLKAMAKLNRAMGVSWKGTN